MGLAPWLPGVRGPRATAAGWWRRGGARIIDDGVLTGALLAAQRLTGWRTPNPAGDDAESRPTVEELEAMTPEQACALMRRRPWREFARRWAEHEHEQIGEARRADVLTILARLAYAAVLAGSGTTPGKRALGLRVVDPRGGPPGLRRALVREMALDGLRSARLFLPPGVRPPPWPATLLLAAAGMVDGLWALADAQGRALHDILAGTRVMRGH